MSCGKKAKAELEEEKIDPLKSQWPMEGSTESSCPVNKPKKTLRGEKNLYNNS